MTNADLKRKLQVGQKLVRIYPKREETPIVKEVNGVQTNGIYLKTVGSDVGGVNRESWLEFHPAGLTEADEKGFRLYGIGKRDATAEEKAIIDGYEALRDKKQEELDMLSDGSQTFFQEKRYYSEHSAEYLFAGHSSNGNRFGKRRDFNDRTGIMIFDPEVKGELVLEYQFV